MCKNKQTRFEVVDSELVFPNGDTLSRQMVDAGHSIFLLLHDGNDKLLFIQQRIPFGAGLQYNLPTVSFDPNDETLLEAANRLAIHETGFGICAVSEVCAPFQMAATFMDCTCHIVCAQLAVHTEEKPLVSKGIEKLEWIKAKEARSFLTNQLREGTFKGNIPLDGRAIQSLLAADWLHIL